MGGYLGGLPNDMVRNTGVFCLGPAALLIPAHSILREDNDLPSTKFACEYKLIEQYNSKPPFHL